MIKRYIGEFGRYFDHYPAPELRVFENIRFVDAGDFLAAITSQVKRHPRDALDLGAGIGHGVDGASLLAVFDDPARRSLVDRAGELAHDYTVGSIDKLVLERRGIE